MLCSINDINNNILTIQMCTIYYCNLTFTCLIVVLICWNRYSLYLITWFYNKKTPRLCTLTHLGMTHIACPSVYFSSVSEKDAELERMLSELDGRTAKIQALQDDLDAQKKKNDVSPLLLSSSRDTLSSGHLVFLNTLVLVFLGSHFTLN